MGAAEIDFHIENCIHICKGAWKLEVGIEYIIGTSVAKDSVTTVEQHIQESESTESKQAKHLGYPEEKAFSR